MLILTDSQAISVKQYTALISDFFIIFAVTNAGFIARN